PLAGRSGVGSGEVDVAAVVGVAVVGLALAKKALSGGDSGCTSVGVRAVFTAMTPPTAVKSRAAPTATGTRTRRMRGGAGITHSGSAGVGMIQVRSRRRVTSSTT